jgi:HPt (histidine-containing phosphotransfer) domain-containing protein
VSGRFLALRGNLPAGSLRELVRQFFDDDAGALADLQAAAAAGTHGAVLAAAHKFKGSARMLGFDAVATAAEALEDWSRAEGRPQALRTLMLALADALDATWHDPAVAGAGEDPVRPAAEPA